MEINSERQLKRGNFEWLNANLENWKKRRDLLDYVITMGADFTVKLIQNVDTVARVCVLAALFDKGDKGMIDGVLEKVGCDDLELSGLTNYRPELAGSFEKFFRVLDKIVASSYQYYAVRWGVNSLFEAGRHDLVVPLVKALGKRTFKSKSLKEGAIRMAFWEGAERGKQDIVEEYCEHHAITSENMLLD